MKLKANDTLHISAVKSDNILPGEEFEVSDAEGQRLIDAGYATQVKAAKKAPAPSNKKAPEAKNKAAPAAKGK